MSHIVGNEDLMSQTIKFVRSIRRKAKAKETEIEYVPNAKTRAAIEECESRVKLASTMPSGSRLDECQEGVSVRQIVSHTGFTIKQVRSLTDKKKAK